MGIRLPFAAVAGVAMGRACGRQRQEPQQNAVNRRISFGATVTVVAGVAVGLVSQFQVGASQLEAKWKSANSSQTRRELAIEGGSLFPTDFYFPLLQSYDEFLREERSRGASPKLVALNRALRLCPSCSFIHEEVARVLLRLGLKGQALSSFRDAVRLAPPRLGPLLTELDQRGYTSGQLVTLAPDDGQQMMLVARYLVPKKAATAVAELLDRAALAGVPELDRLLLHADLAATLDRPTDARATLDRAIGIAPRDGRPYLALANLDEQEGHLAIALERVATATTLSPYDIDSARRRLDLVLKLSRWNELDTALQRLTIALRQRGHNVTEVHLIAGQTHEARGNLPRALSEFRTATTLDGLNPATWIAVARVSEASGNLNGALDAYRRVALLRPADDSAPRSIVRLEKAQAELRLKQLLP